jgi:hypothetical protein
LPVLDSAAAGSADIEKSCDEKLLFALRQLVGAELGQAFTEVPPISLHEMYRDCDSSTPVIFVL